MNSSSNSTNQTITNTPSDPVLPANQDIIDNINVIMEDTISNIKKGKGVGEDSTQSENSRTLSSSNSVGSNSNSPSKENAYEVNKRISKSLIRDSFIYEIIAALLLIILFIIGFMRYKPNI